MQMKKIACYVMIGIAILAANISESQAQIEKDTAAMSPVVSIADSNEDNPVHREEAKDGKQEIKSLEPEKLGEELKPSLVPMPEKQSEQTENDQIKKTAINEMNSGYIINPYAAYGYEQMIKDAQQLESLYPDIIELSSVGKSVEGRELLLIKLGKGDKKILLCGSHHAREYISSTFLMKMVDEYAVRYKKDRNFGEFEVKNLLDQVTVYIVPMVNPDGVNLVQNGIQGVINPEKVKNIKMLQPDYSQWKANINGVDLNRQYPAAWDVKKSNTHVPSSEMFKGDSAASEPEVQAMMELSRQHEFLLAASFHSKGEVIYWADSGTYKDIPQAEKITDKLSKLTGYERMPISQDPAVYGAGYENWFRLEFKRPAFCIELTPYNGTDIPHPDEKFDSLVWNRGKYIGLLLMQEALDFK